MINNLHFVQLSALLLLLLSFATSCQNDCPDNCSGSGRCEIDQSCTCDPGFTGLACEFEDSCNEAALDCGEHGRCASGRCNCDEGYYGTLCDSADLCLVNQVECLNGGECIAENCDCPDGFVGSQCELIDKCYQVSCAFDEPCVDGSCFCSAYTTGELCAEKRIDIHLGSYSGQWTIRQNGNTSTFSGAFTLVESTDKAMLQGEADGYLESDPLSFQFISSNLNRFNVIGVGMNNDVEGNGEIISASLSFGFTMRDALGNTVEVSFEP